MPGHSRHKCGGDRRGRRAWLWCAWAVGGMVAVPVGGGRARAGLEIDRSEPSGSRVVISRAGRLRVGGKTGLVSIKQAPRP